MERLRRNDAEAARPRRHRLVEGNVKLLHEGKRGERSPPLHGQEQHEGDQQQPEREAEDDPRVQGKPPPPARRAAQEAERAEVVDDEKADAPQDGLQRQRQHDPRIVLKSRQRIGPQGEARVAEPHDRIEDALVDVAEPDVEQHRAKPLDHQHRADDPADEALEPVDLRDPVGVH